MSQSQSDGKTFFGHPIQLSILFHIELWERFSFSGLQGILMLYLYYELSKGGLGMDKTVVGGIVGAYGGGVYLSTIFGAWLADRVWGTDCVGHCGDARAYRAVVDSRGNGAADWAAVDCAGQRWCEAFC